MLIPLDFVGRVPESASREVVNNWQIITAFATTIAALASAFAASKANSLVEKASVARLRPTLIVQNNFSISVRKHDSQEIILENIGSGIAKSIDIKIAGELAEEHLSYIKPESVMKVQIPPTGGDADLHYTKFFKVNEELQKKNAELDLDISYRDIENTRYQTMMKLRLEVDRYVIDRDSAIFISSKTNE